MINRIFVDNYRCFVDFEWKPGSLNLLLGDNGTGKTSLFDVLETVRDFVTNPAESRVAFPTGALAAGGDSQEQSFELGITGNGGQYSYKLVIEHAADRLKNRVKLETLTFDDIMLYRFEDNEAHLFRDDGGAGPVFPFDWNRSAIGTIPDRRDNTRLTWFRSRLERIYVFSPAPSQMEGSTAGEAVRPARNLSNYAAWLRHLNNDPACSVRLMDSLREVLDGFTGIRFVTLGDLAKELRFLFDYTGEQPHEMPFQHLSDGQRCLAALYTSLHVLSGTDVSLLWDEPDNYVSLREIQPFLRTLEDLAEGDGKQCLLISHHPELINRLAARHGVQMYRDAAGAARAKPFAWEGRGVSPAELVARGWEA